MKMSVVEWDYHARDIGVVISRLLCLTDMFFIVHISGASSVGVEQLHCCFLIGHIGFPLVW